MDQKLSNSKFMWCFHKIIVDLFSYFRKEKAEGQLMDYLEVKDIFNVIPIVACL